MRNIPKPRVYKFNGIVLYRSYFMSSYDIRNAAQIAIDELIIKYKRRLKELETSALKYTEDADLLNRLNLLAADLAVLKITIDKASKKGDLNGKKK